MVVRELFLKFPSGFLSFTAGQRGIYFICWEYPWGLPLTRDLAGNANCKNTPRKPKAWPGATLLSGGGTEDKEGEKIWSVVTMLCKLGKQTQIQRFLQMPAQGSGWQIPALASAQILKEIWKSGCQKVETSSWQ